MISQSAMIIVGLDVSESLDKGFSAVHLHDCRNSIVVRHEQKIVAVEQGNGFQRTKGLYLAFENILRCDLKLVPLGHNCLHEQGFSINSDVKDDSLQNYLFYPASLSLLVKGIGEEDIFLVELGTTPTPLLIPKLLGNHKELANPHSLIQLCKKAVSWANNLNKTLSYYRSTKNEISSGIMKDKYLNLEYVSKIGLDSTLEDVKKTFLKFNEPLEVGSAGL